MDWVISLLSGNLASSGRLMLANFQDLSPVELVRQPGWKVRSALRILGTAAMADREALIQLDVDDLPDVPPGFEAHFSRWGNEEETHAFSRDMNILAIFQNHRETLVRSVEALAPERLDHLVEIPDHFDEDAVFSYETFGQMIIAIASYTILLVGEASLVRLALGKTPMTESSMMEAEIFQALPLLKSLSFPAKEKRS